MLQIATHDNPSIKIEFYIHLPKLWFSHRWVWNREAVKQRSVCVVNRFSSSESSAGCCRHPASDHVPLMHTRPSFVLQRCMAAASFKVPFWELRLYSMVHKTAAFVPPPRVESLRSNREHQTQRPHDIFCLVLLVQKFGQEA